MRKLFPSLFSVMVVNWSILPFLSFFFFLLVSLRSCSTEKFYFQIVSSYALSLGSQTGMTNSMEKPCVVVLTLGEGGLKRLKKKKKRPEVTLFWCQNGSKRIFRQDQACSG
jgi:hypothetical protein